MNHHVSWATPLACFVKELSLIDPTLTIRWNNRVDRWIIYHGDDSVCLRVEHPILGTYRELDMRVLRKLQINIFFTHHDKAMQLYTENSKDSNRELRQYITRGADGISDYLSGWNKED